MNQHDQTSRRETAGSSVSPFGSDEVITSAKNPRVVDTARLSRRRTRRERGQYLVEGPNATAEVLAAGVVTTLFVTEDRADDYVDSGVEITVVADHVLARLADSQHPQGVVAVARLEPASLADVLPCDLLVVLEAPSDPGNLGTIIRTADSAGAAGVVVCGNGVDPWNPKVVRSTVGSLVHLPVVVDVDIADVLDRCRAAGMQVVGLDAAGRDEVFTLEDDPAPVAVVLGNEAHGLSAEARAGVDRLLAVPTYGRAESLNLAAAAAVTVYAAARGRRGVARASGSGHEQPDE